MSGLPDFLLARIAEDEDVARDASPGPWDGNAERDTVVAVDGIEVCDGFALSGRQLRATVDHVARHDPARVLAECEAKRRIVDWHQEAVVDQGGVDEDSGHAFSAAYDMACRALATPYADHPDYRPEWKP